MHGESFQGSRTRELVAPNVYRRHKRDGTAVYEVVFKDADGKQRVRRLDAATERAAIREARAVLAQRDGGSRVVASGVTLDSFAQSEYFLMLDSLARAGRRSEQGVALYRDRYRISLESRLGHLRFDQVEARHLAALLRDMREQGYAESTLAGMLIVLRGIYRLALRRKLVSTSPLDGLDPAELPRPRTGGAGRVLDEVQLAALVRHAKEHYSAALTVLAYSGLRISEALGLTWASVDFVERELHVRWQLERPRKGKASRLIPLKTEASERDVPMFPAIEQALAEHLRSELEAGRGREGDLVFTTRAGRPLQQRNVAAVVEHAAKAAGLGKVAPKDLRASFCSVAARDGRDPAGAAEITGHSVDVWARFYVRSFGKAQRDEARERMLAHGFGAVPEVENASQMPADSRRTG